MKIKDCVATLICLVILANCEGQNKKKNASAFSNEKTANSILIDTSKQLMNEDEFWMLLEKSRKASAGYQEQISSLKRVLIGLNAIDIEKFNNTFTALLAATYDYKLWGAAYVINGGCSDDCFDYFREYLIAQGKEKFYQTIKNPDSSVSWVKSEDEENWKGLQYAALEAYKQKTGNEIPKTYQPKFELKGTPFDEETVFKQYPKLAKKFAE